jgi:ribosome maturation factor RimP
MPVSIRGNMADKKKITEIVAEVLEGFLAEHGLELYHTEFRKEGKDWYLNVFIDIAEDVRNENEKNGEVRYVSTDDCETVSDYLSDKLDELDPIEQNYMLQVSSPGMDRELYEQKDFDRFTGELVDVKLYRAENGNKLVTGTLVGRKDGFIVIADENGCERSFAEKDVAKTCLAVIF